MAKLFHVEIGHKKTIIIDKNVPSVLYDHELRNQHILATVEHWAYGFLICRQRKGMVEKCLYRQREISLRDAQNL